MAMQVEQLVVARWRRYGKDRLYVNSPDGRTLGYLDQHSGKVHVEDESQRTLVETAVRGQSVPSIEQPVIVPSQSDGESPAGHSRAAGAKAPIIPDLQFSVTISRLAVDLAQNAAGGSARSKAREHQTAAPVRTLLARLAGKHTDERAWRVGAKGEQAVGRLLDRMGPAWTVVHDVPVGEKGANIDHVVVGPPGVFTVNTKWHEGKSVWVGGDSVLVNGHRTAYVQKARHEAARASRLLAGAYGEAVPVLGVVAVLADSWTIKSQPADGTVLVVAPRRACQFLEQLPSRYGAGDLTRLSLLARRSTTWRP